MYYIDADGVNTKWSVIFALNAIVYLVLAISTLCLCICPLSPFFCIFGLCGAIGMTCSLMGHFAAIIVTGVFRYSDAGDLCAE